MSSEYDFDLEDLKRNSNVILSSNLKEFIGEIEDYSTYTKNGRPYLRLRIYVEEGTTTDGKKVKGAYTVVVYPPLYQAELAKRLEDMGFRKMKEVVGHSFKWQIVELKPNISNKQLTIYPRHLPVELVENENEEEEEEENEEENNETLKQRLRKQKKGEENGEENE